MKIQYFLYMLVVILISTIGCELNNTNDNNSNTTDPQEYDALILTYAIVLNDTEYAMDTRGTIEGDLPYKTNMTQLIAKFTLSEGAKLYRGDIEQISGETVNDFSSYFEYKVISQDGKKEYIYPVDIQVTKNTEAKLYSMSVLVGSTTYPCTIGSSTITVDFPDKYKADLFNVILNFVISEDATIHDGVWPTSLQNGGTFNIGSYIGSIWFRVKAQNTAYYADYDMNVTCINCNL